MSQKSIDRDSVGPELDLRDVRLPPHVGERLGTLFGREGRVETGAEWVAAMRAAATELDGEPPDEDDLCTAPDGAHAVEIGGKERSYVCVLDPLIVPFLRGEPGVIHSTTPEYDESVTVEIDADGARATPADAVISLGVSHDVAAEEVPTYETVYTKVCPYVHAFALTSEYEQWAGSVDAATTAVPVETGVAVARELSEALFE